MALHCQTLTQGPSIFPSPLILQYITQKHFILITLQVNNMLQWSTEHIFPAHSVGLKAVVHATVSTEPFPNALNSYLIFLILPLILLCFYFSKHDMKATFLYSFTFEISYISKLWCHQDNFISSLVKYICSTDVKQIFCFTTQFKASYINNWIRWCFVMMPRYLSVSRSQNPVSDLLQDNAEWLAFPSTSFSAPRYCSQTWETQDWTSKGRLQICV